MYSTGLDEIKLHILINGKSKEYYSVLQINSAINTLKRLKDVISQSVRNKFSSDKMLIFNYKGLELDEADIEYLKHNEILFVSLDGHPFISSNYLNQFEFLEYIKSGGYGKIYEARNIITNEHVAIKKIETNYLSSEEIYNISREAVYLESFKHKNIIKIYLTFLCDNVFYTIMELAKGGELNSHLKDKKNLAENETKKLFKQIHDAVKYIHSKNVIHRDLNPFNILFKDETKENILLIDFGISGMYSGNVKEKINAGTIRFIPPEVASGSNISSNPKIDNWALGVILYFMLFGIYPFNGDSDMEILNEIQKTNFKFPKDIIVSKTCKEIITKFLNKHPDMRLELNDEVFDKWYSEEFEEKNYEIETEKTDEILIGEVIKKVSVKIGKLAVTNFRNEKRTLSQSEKSSGIKKIKTFFSPVKSNESTKNATLQSSVNKNSSNLDNGLKDNSQLENLNKNKRSTTTNKYK